MDYKFYLGLLGWDRTERIILNLGPKKNGFLFEFFYHMFIMFTFWWNFNIQLSTIYHGSMIKHASNWRGTWILAPVLCDLMKTFWIMIKITRTKFIWNKKKRSTPSSIIQYTFGFFLSKNVLLPNTYILYIYIFYYDVM